MNLLRSGQCRNICKRFENLVVLRCLIFYHTKVALVAVVSVPFKPSGESTEDARGHWVKRAKMWERERGAGRKRNFLSFRNPPPAQTFFAPFYPMPSRVFRTCLAWLKRHGNDCYVGCTKEKRIFVNSREALDLLGWDTLEKKAKMSSPIFSF